MISNDQELAQTRVVLQNLEEALLSLKSSVQERNPALFEAMAQDYLRNIKSLRAEIEEYVGVTDLESSIAPLWLTVGGENIGLWSTAAGIWEETISRIRKSVLSLSKHLMESSLPYLTPEQISALPLVDFKIVGAQPGSLRIGLDFVTPGQGELFEREAPNFSRDALQKILLVGNWLAQNGSVDDLNRQIPNEHERNYIVSKTAPLIPSRKSKVAYLELSGAIVPSRSAIRLVPGHRAKVRELFRTEDESVPAEEEGVIREIDLDKRHCILRQRPDSLPDLPCRFGSSLVSQIRDGLDKRVRITGSLKRGTTSPLNIQMVEIIENN